MKIKPKYVIEFEIELDEDTSFSYVELKIFFEDFPSQSIIELIGSNNTLSIYLEEYLENEKIFKYFLDQKILMGSDLSHFFWVLEKEKFKNLMIELEEAYNDLTDNHKAYEREFLIDSIT